MSTSTTPEKGATGETRDQLLIRVVEERNSARELVAALRAECGDLENRELYSRRLAVTEKRRAEALEYRLARLIEQTETTA